MPIMKAPRILQVTACPFPPEIRVVKEGLSLVEAGYEVTVVCPPVKGRPERETWRGIRVIRPALLGNVHVADKVVYHTLFFSLAWYRALREVIAEVNPNAIHVHDIWLGRTALLAKGTQKTVMDLHENMPAAVVEYLKGYRGAFKLLNLIFKNGPRIHRYERSILKGFDRTLVVVREAQERVLASHPSLPQESVVNVENLESKDFLESSDGSGEPLAADHFSVLYIGGFGPHRGIDTLIEAMGHVKRWGLNVRLHLIGAKEGSYLRMLRELIEELDVGSHVSVVGWVPFETVLSYIRSASVGAVPHHSNPHTDNTIPHKLYQYMIASTPVLVSTSAPLARTVEAAGAGLVFQAGDAADCAERIREVYQAPDLLARCAASGYRYVMAQGHNWEEEAAPMLLEAYRELLGGGGKA